MITYILIILIIGYGGYRLWPYLKAFWNDEPMGSSTQRRRQRFLEESGAPVAPKPPDEIEIIQDLMRRYVFIVPQFAMYKGKRIPLSSVTDEMRDDISFVSPAQMGQWIDKEIFNGPRQ